MTEEAQGAPTDDIRHIFRWDLDKTYLRTDFDTWKDLVRTAIERPETKRTVPGASSLLRELRASTPAIVTILSGSPEQMRRSLESKLRLDGIQWDEFLLKPSLRNIFRGRFKALRNQVGYKLPALLAARTRSNVDVPETLFGDDAEADALVYSLYADLLGGRVDEATLNAVLEAAEVYPDVIAETLELVRAVPRTDPVRRIFIHLDRRTDPGFFRQYGPRVVPIYNYFQASLALVDDAVLSAEAALRVAASLVHEHDFSVDDLGESARDLLGRGHASPTALVAVADAARSIGEPFPLTSAQRDALAARLRQRPEVGLAPPVVTIDYLASLRDDRARWELARKQSKLGG